MSLHDILVPVLDTCYREPRLKWRTRGVAGNGEKGCKPYVFMVDGRINHGGMFDRLKGLVTIYAIAKSLGKDFRIDWTYPFDVSKYLEPVSHDWRITEDKMRWGLLNHNVVIAYGETANPSRLWKERNRETHFYYGFNSVDKVNEHFGTCFDWGELYRELFRPTAYLQQYLDHYKEEIGSEYITIHTRFMNLLGDKIETVGNPIVLPEAEQQELKEKTKATILSLMEKHPGMRVMIASDSNEFIKYISWEISSVYIVPGNIKHVDTVSETDDSENIKVFTDYYLMAGATHVYNLKHGAMYRSAFPEYAAKIGGVEFTRVEF